MSATSSLTAEQEKRADTLLEQLPSLEERADSLLEKAKDLRGRTGKELQSMDEALEEVQIERTEMRRALYDQQSDTLAAMAKLQASLAVLRNGICQAATNSMSMSKGEEEDLTRVCNEMQSVVDGLTRETKEKQQKLVFLYDSIAEFLHDKKLIKEKRKQQQQQQQGEQEDEDKEEDERIKKLTMMANILRHLKTSFYEKTEGEEQGEEQGEEEQGETQEDDDE